jgi:hypothetical protein
MLLTSLPVEVDHIVDHHSALSPRKTFPLRMDSRGLVLRSADSGTGNREEVVCPVCGESYGTYERLWKHVQYNRIVEERDDYPRETTHLGFEMPVISPINLQEVKFHVENFISEIVVVVEGIDPQVSGTFQALQSYKYEDVVWEGSFEPCLSVRQNKFVVDLEAFHRVRVPGSEEFFMSGSEDSDPDIIVERKEIVSKVDKEDGDNDGDSVIFAPMKDATENGVDAMENGTHGHQQ